MAQVAGILTFTMVTKFLDASLLFQLGYGTATKIGCSNFLLYHAWPASPASMAVYEMHSIQFVVAVLPMVRHEMPFNETRLDIRHTQIGTTVSFLQPFPGVRRYRRVGQLRPLQSVTPDLPYCVLPSAVSWCPHFIRHMKCS